MSRARNLDEFSPKIRRQLAERASYICSNPGCRTLTLSPSEADPSKVTFIGRAAHITAAAPNGPRFDPSLSPDERASATNGIFLCVPCADKIDKNSGVDYPVKLLREWKDTHEVWIRRSLNKPMRFLSDQVSRIKSHQQYSLPLREINLTLSLRQSFSRDDLGHFRFLAVIFDLSDPDPRSSLWIAGRSDNSILSGDNPALGIKSLIWAVDPNTPIQDTNRARSTTADKLVASGNVYKRSPIDTVAQLDQRKMIILLSERLSGKIESITLTANNLPLLDVHVRDISMLAIPTADLYQNRLEWLERRLAPAPLSEETQHFLLNQYKEVPWPTAFSSDVNQEPWISVMPEYPTPNSLGDFFYISTIPIPQLEWWTYWSINLFEE